MDNCKIIEDLLPSYCDGLTSEETNELIHSHVESCPNCKRLLEKMSAQPPREIIDHWEQFRRKLKEYEQNHRIKTLRIAIICIVLLSTLMLVWANSFTICKLVADSKMEESVDRLVDRSDTEYRYVYYTLGQSTVVTLAKNDKLNYWYIADIDDSTTHVWFGKSNYRWYGDTGLTAEPEFHYLYTGADAKAFIELDYRDIPGDVYVEVNQHGAHYWIHVVSDNVDAINQLELIELLRTKGYIE